uniref:Protein FAR1-RELATED SEQUENCE n=1 Tax=Cajanus cajan TaxID=3821 RepID=A0A151RJS9_CAJCA|nr:Protein FAR1-RELATED SEQUENCE 5 [Cajanus cajan]
MIFFFCKNHHPQIVIFSCAIISYKSTDAYKWVLKSFLNVMPINHSKVVVTYGDGIIREAIKYMFPGATYRLCVWHMQKKNDYDNIKNVNFLNDFKIEMYDNLTPEKFKRFWKELVERHRLQENNW